VGARWRRRGSPGAVKARRSRPGGRLDLATRRVLLPVAGLSIAAGLGLLGYTGYQVWDPGARQAQNQLMERLHEQWARHPAAARGTAPGGTAPGGTAPGGTGLGGAAPAKPIELVTGQPFALLRIPAFGAQWRFAVVEGTTLTQLAEGPGHVPGTQLPGEPGNFAVAAHDITAGNPFLHLGSLRKGDGIAVTTVNGTYQYRVLTERVVRYTDVGVLDPVPDEPGQRPVSQFITLLTCTPVTLAFTPWRIVVTGVLTGMTPAAAS
jgi:LPXTG-site transpeptidase (sortase) family protein